MEFVAALLGGRWGSCKGFVAMVGTFEPGIKQIVIGVVVVVQSARRNHPSKRC
jgi:hypothetical protein